LFTVVTPAAFRSVAVTWRGVRYHRPTTIIYRSDGPVDKSRNMTWAGDETGCGLRQRLIVIAAMTLRASLGVPAAGREVSAMTGGDKPEPDYYAVLGVPPLAGQITSAYRRLVRALHPDTARGGAATRERFAQVVAAYETATSGGSHLLLHSIRRRRRAPTAPS
jgi:hypothetical protein